MFISLSTPLQTISKYSEGCHRFHTSILIPLFLSNANIIYSLHYLHSLSLIKVFTANFKLIQLLIFTVTFPFIEFSNYSFKFLTSSSSPLSN